MKKNVKIFGYLTAIIMHLALFWLVMMPGHDNSNEEEMIPVAVTVYDDVAEPTGEMVVQESAPPAPEPPMPEPPAPEPIPEPPKPVPEPEPKSEPVVTVAEPEPKPQPEPPKPQPQPEPEPKPAKPQKTRQELMQERVQAAKRQQVKTQQPQTPAPAKRPVSGSDIYRPQPASGKAAIKGTVASDGRAIDQANAQQRYYSIVDTKIRALWNACGPNELGAIPTPVVVSFTVTSTGMISGFRIKQRSNSPAMNMAAERLGEELNSSRFKSFSESGISGLGTSPIQISFELKYQNQ